MWCGLHIFPFSENYVCSITRNIVQLLDFRNQLMLQNVPTPMMFSVEMNKKTLLPSSKFISNAILYVPYLFDCQPPLILSRT